MPSRDEFDFGRAREDATRLVLLGAAHKAGLFEALAEEKDISSLKRALDADERALYIVLEALCSLGFADKRENRYIIADKARPLLLRGGKDYVGGSLPHFLNILEAWLALPEIIRGAKPGKRTPLDIAAFMHAMASKPDEFVEGVVNECMMRKSDSMSMLDLGGGPGKYARAFASRGLEAVLYDLPEVIDYAGKEFGLENIQNLALMRGDFTKEGFTCEFKGESFDIVFMGNICHIYSEEENRRLIKNAAKLTKKAGLVAIEDFVRGRSPGAEIFAVNMLANTDGGNTWTEAQYREWLKEAGFSSIEVIDIDGKEKQLITALRRGK